ncbi:MAG: hypothetical protein R6V40_02610 [Candidatus Moraniibacteriota bacterium]
MKNLKLKKITDQISWWLGVVTIGLSLGVFIQFTQAWVSPPSNPPNSNIGAPINTGGQPQYKSSGIGATVLEGDQAVIADDYSWSYVKGNRVCIGNDCRSSWQDLYKSGDKICIEDGGCVTAEDEYIGDSGTHYAGGNLNMAGHDITNVDDIRLNDIYKSGYGSIDMYDHLDMNGRNILHVGRIYLDNIYPTGWKKPIDVRADIDMNYRDISNLSWPTSGRDAATKEYVDDQVGSAGGDISCDWNGWYPSCWDDWPYCFKTCNKCVSRATKKGIYCSGGKVIKMETASGCVECAGAR